MLEVRYVETISSGRAPWPSRLTTAAHPAGSQAPIAHSGPIPARMRAAASSGRRLPPDSVTQFALFRERLPEVVEVFCAVADGLESWDLY